MVRDVTNELDCSPDSDHNVDSDDQYVEDATTVDNTMRDSVCDRVPALIADAVSDAEVLIDVVGVEFTIVLSVVATLD